MVEGVSGDIAILLVVFSALVVVVVCLLAKCKQLIADRLERRKQQRARQAIRS